MASTQQQRFHRQLFLQLLEVADVEAVELLADLEHEDAEDQDADQHVERDAELDHHRHAVGRRRGGEEQAVLHRQEADHLRHRLRADDHHHEGEQHAGQGDAERAAGDRRREPGDRLGEIEGEDHQDDADQHRRRHVDQRLDVPAHVEALDHPVQQHRDQDHLEQEGQTRRQVEVRLAGDVADHRGRGDQGDALQREQVDQREDPALRDHRERQQQDRRREQVDQLGRAACRLMP